MKLNMIAAVLSIAAAPLLAQAAGNMPDMSKAIDPGLWETTVNMQMAGVPMQIAGQSVKHCVTQADLDKNHGIPQPANTKDMSCKMQKFDFSGKVATYTMKCTGKQGDMTMNGSTTLDSRDASHGTMTMNGTMEGHAMQMTTSYTSKRIGDCSTAAASSGSGE